MEVMLMEADNEQQARPPRRKTAKRRAVMIYLTDAEIDTIDEARGDEDRSTYIRTVVKQHISQEQREVRNAAI
jgi:hypothetical protein